MIWRHLPSLFISIALILLGLAVYSYYLTTDAPGAAIPEPDREFPRLKVGANEVRFTLQNPTRHTVRVIGCQFC